MVRNKEHERRPDDVNREETYVRKTPAQDRKPVRDDKKPDTPPKPTRPGGLSGGRWKK